MTSKSSVSKASEKTEGARVLMLNPAVLLPAAGNREVDRESPEFLALVTSVREVGVRVPCVATAEKGGKYRLRAGHRRSAAALVAKSQDDAAEKLGGKASENLVRHCDTIPVLVVGDSWGDDVGAVENLHKRGLTTGERIRLYESLVAKGWTHEKVARTTGESRSTVTNCIGVRGRLVPALQKLLDDNDTLPLGKLLTVGGLNPPDQLAKWDTYGNVPKPGKKGKETGAPEKRERSALAVLTIIVRADGSIESSIREPIGGEPGNEETPRTWAQAKVDTVGSNISVPSSKRTGVFRVCGVSVTIRRESTDASTSEWQSGGGK